MVKKKIVPRVVHKIESMKWSFEPEIADDGKNRQNK